MDITVIIPYNKDRGFLKEAVAAAKDQDFSGTYQIIKQKGDHGVAKNFNDALKKAKGTFIKGCAEDDLLLPNCLTALYEEIIKGYDLVCARAINFDDKGYEQEVQSIIQPSIMQLAVSNTIHGGTTMYRKSALLEVGGMDERMWCCEEFDLHLRMLAKGMRIGVIEDLVFAYRIHGLMNSGMGGSPEGDRIKSRHRVKQAILANYRGNHLEVNTIPQSKH